jgi:aconitate hydratase
MAKEPTDHPDSFSTRSTLRVGDVEFEINKLSRLADVAGHDVSRLPYGIKVLLENLLRHEDGLKVTASDIDAVLRWDDHAGDHGTASETSGEISFTPERVLMQDFTGVPGVVDLAGMRDALATIGGDPAKINPQVPVELVIDHSVIAERSGTSDAFSLNVDIEYNRNVERYQLLRWAQGSFKNFRVVPPGTGICHQVNLEYLSRVVFSDADRRAYCDTLVGTDSHTTMVNGLGVLGWGVGGIEAEAAMLGQPLPMLLPAVVGLRLHGELREGTTATDLVLTITELLRHHGVVGKFVEAFGPGVPTLPVEVRATIANMSPEYGATCTLFPIDHATIDYLRFTGRDDDHLALVEGYAKEQGLWHEPSGDHPIYSEVVDLDLSTVEASLAGPSRPQDRVSLTSARSAFRSSLGRDPRSFALTRGRDSGRPATPADRSLNGTPQTREIDEIRDGDVVVAAITSCTNTSNPQVLVAAGLLAKRAVERGLSSKPWVKTTLAPGSRVVIDYLNRAGLVEPLEKLGFYLVGFGCTTCIGNSGPLLDGVSDAVREHEISVVSVLSGNRNFEGRIHPDVRMNYLASPPLVVAYALAGTIDVDLSLDPLGTDRDGKPVTLAEIWPSNTEIAETIRNSLSSNEFRNRYSSVFEGDERWHAVSTARGETFSWDESSTYILPPPFFDGISSNVARVTDISSARVLAVLGDSVTTDHISPAGSIGVTTPAGKYLAEHGVARDDFNSYGARRGNHEVMMRGTFANVRLRNRLAPGTEGGVTLHLPDGEQLSIYDASMKYKEEHVPLIVIAGKEYGSGSSRDWAAKGTALLGVRAVIAESYERIHRSNLVGMGVLPLQFPAGKSADSLGLDGHEIYSITGIARLGGGEGEGGDPPKSVVVSATRNDGSEISFEAVVRIDTPMEAEYFRNGGVLNYVLRRLASN